MAQSQTDALSPANTIVVEAGMVGIATAITLQRRGHRVLIIDPDKPLQRASYGNAGVISPASILPMAGPGIWSKLFEYATNRNDGLRLRYWDSRNLLGWGRRCLPDSSDNARVRTAGDS